METARIAVQAALTGHLVLATLHTNDAPIVGRPTADMGIEPYLLASALNGVLAQRLARKICESCKTPANPKEDLLDFLTAHGFDISNLMTSTGCGKCRETGYSGRLGLYELLVLDDHLRDAIARNPNVTEFRRQCSERGMMSLRMDGFQKAAAGHTTVEEVLRVTEATI
jgi:type IV pilus assembly protein PilB